MESLTQEQDKLVQMGNIKGKDQALSIGVLNALKEIPRIIIQSCQRKRNQKKPKSSHGGSNPPKEKEKKGKYKYKYNYCNKGWYPYISCMNKNIDQMA